MKHPENHIFEFTPETLGAWCEQRRMPRFRGKQVLEWVYEKGVADPAAMTNLSKLDREVLARDMTFLSGEVLRHLSASDGTQKLLVEWDDCVAGRAGSADANAPRTTPTTPANEPTGGRRTLSLTQAAQPIGDPSRQTECVMIPSAGAPKRDDDGDATEDLDEAPGLPRFTACISSQVGCPVGCRFCASGLTGLDHNLSAGRIVEQVWRLGRLAGVRRITNVVFMGMGEPLANLGAVVPAVKTLNALWATGISARKITISTVGLPQAIEKLARQLDLPVTLALSLHAPDDETRRRLIPWAEYTTIADLMEACRAWFEKTGREITLEYTLLRGVNDCAEQAGALAGIARTLRANVNLIRYNEVAGLGFQRPLTEDVHEFQRVLRARGVNAHIRASRGRDIAAACGQLRHENAAKTG
ncbi:MAG: 23S rRNA (adenine(2503)-C(2))-methyltransferase RlmN [Planctomycetota bacterium]|nr:23S rRNA (adenine(2503)-C(2))-methyltransferase RlmN [Planctomycetota bacterium]